MEKRTEFILHRLWCRRLDFSTGKRLQIWQSEQMILKTISYIHWEVTDIVSLFHFLSNKQNGLLSFPLIKYGSKPKWTDLINTSRQTPSTDSNRNLWYGLFNSAPHSLDTYKKTQSSTEGVLSVLYSGNISYCREVDFFFFQIRVISLENLYFDEFFWKTKHTDKTFAVNMSTPMNTCNIHSTSALLVQAIRLFWFL